MRTLGFPPAVDHQVALVVRQLDEAFAAERAVKLLRLVALLVLLQRVLHLELLPTGVAREGLQVNPQVSLQVFCTGEGFVTRGTGAAGFPQVRLQVLVQLFWEGEFLPAVGTGEALPVRSLPMRHCVPL